MRQNYSSNRAFTFLCKRLVAVTKNFATSGRSFLLFFFPGRSHKKYRWIRLIWAAVFVFTLTVLSYFLYLWWIASPSFSDLENPKYDLASFIFDDKDEVIGKYYVENREQVVFDSINPWLIHATLMEEDERFYQHDGIDYAALWRVGIKTILLGQKQSGGGSTITQQLAKLLYKRPPISNLNSFSSKTLLIHSKLKEWVTAIKLEHNYTKEEILAIYLNKFEFVNGAHGIQAASKIYFNKLQKDLSPEECALLVGMLQNPSYFNPVRFPARAKKRRDKVLRKVNPLLKKSGIALDSLLASQPDLSRFRQTSPVEGPAPYFRNEVTKIITELFEDNSIVKEDGSPYNIFLDGLKIYTTIDLEYQALAEEAMKEHMMWIQNRFWKTWQNKDPLTYKATKEEAEARRRNFEKHVKASERYKQLWAFNMPMLESLDQSECEKVLSESPTSISPEMLQLIDSTSLWNEALLAYQQHITIYDSVFNTPVEAEVFDYKNGTISKRLSPIDSVMYHLKHLQAGLLAVDPKTGYVKAWVGGINHDFFQYDHVTSNRQVGSTVKPFVYAAAMQEKGIKPCQYFTDMPYTIKPGEAKFDIAEEWKPDNSTENFTYNPYNLYHGLLYSKNSITVKLMKELGDAEILRKLLKSTGIEVDRPVFGGVAVPNVPAICLGAMDVSLFEMVGAYTTFVNKGVYSKPQIIKRIEDRNGRVIYNGFSPKRVAIEPLTASIVGDMLQNNCKRNFGFNFKSLVGGKTGTTNDFVDGWFIGFTPSLVVGVWTGGDERYIRFTTLDDGQGYVTARPMFEKYIQKLEKKSKQYDVNAKFPKPDERMRQAVACSHYKVIYPSEEKKLRKMAEEFPDKRDSIMSVLRVN